MCNKDGWLVENLKGFCDWIKRPEADKNGWRMVPIAEFDIKIIEAAIRALKEKETNDPR